MIKNHIITNNEITNAQIKKKILEICKIPDKITLSCEITEDNADCIIAIYQQNNYLDAIYIDNMTYCDIDCDDDEVINMYNNFIKKRKKYLQQYFNIDILGTFNI